MTTSKKAYISQDAFVAFIDRAHPKHLQAAACFRYFAQNGYQLYTTVVTLNDTYHELYQMISPSIARDLMRAIELSTINVLYPEEPDLKKAIRIVTTTQSVELTFTKALMAVLCNKKNIPQICTFEYLHALFGLQLFYLPV
jgi:predicted nucleic acid-binding protein